MLLYITIQKMIVQFISEHVHNLFHAITMQTVVIIYNTLYIINMYKNMIQL